MDTTRSELTKALVRAGLRGNEAGTSELHRNEGPGAATDRAHRQLPTAGREQSPMHGGGMRWANAYLDEFEAAGTEAPALVCWEAHKEPSPGRHTRPVLRLLEGGNRQRPVRYVAGPCLVLIKGGKG